MKLSKKAKKAGIAGASVLAVMMFILFAITSGLFVKTVYVTEPYPIPPRQENHLFVETTYLLKTAETNNTVNVTCTPYVTNTWEEESGEIKIIVYVIDKSNIAEYKSILEKGKIKANSTAEFEIPIVLTKNSSQVDILMFENERLVLKGESTITAQQRFNYTPKGDYFGYTWDIENEGVDFVLVNHNQTLPLLYEQRRACRSFKRMQSNKVR